MPAYEKSAPAWAAGVVGPQLFKVSPKSNKDMQTTRSLETGRGDVMACQGEDERRVLWNSCSWQESRQRVSYAVSTSFGIIVGWRGTWTADRTVPLVWGNADLVGDNGGGVKVTVRVGSHR